MNRPMVGRLTVPFMVDEHKTPIDFATASVERVAECATRGRCGVCGGRIRKGPIAFVGPDDGRTCFADPWMHPECAEVAMGQCPFLSGRRDWKEESGRADPLLATYSAGMSVVLARNWRSHQDPAGQWHFEAVGMLCRV